MRLGRLRRLGGARAAWVVFGAVEVGAIPLLLSWGRKWWFWADDWDFIAARTAGNVRDLFRPHYQHWTTLPILAYRLLWFVFGIRTYVPYQLMVIGAHLIAAALLRTIMRRVGVNPWLATLVAAVFVFFGSGAENILVAFQVTFVGSIVFGLVHLILADHDGGFGRRDWLAVLAGLAALMCSGVGVAMVAIAGVAVLLRRGWRMALLHTTPLAAAYALWFTLSPKGAGGGGYESQSFTQIRRFVWVGVITAISRFGQVEGIGLVLVVITIAGIGLTLRGADLREARRKYAVPLALLLGAVVFLLVTGVVRSGQPNLPANAVGPNRARLSRYVYVVAALALPALAVGADALVRRWRLLAIPVVAVLLVGVPGNIHQMRIYANTSALDRSSFKTDILEVPRLPFASQLRPNYLPDPGSQGTKFAGLTIGWLVRSLPTGRIPAPGPISPSRLADISLDLVLHVSGFPNDAHCRPLTKTVERRLGKLQQVTLKSGVALIRYYPASGGVSRPLLFASPLTTTLAAMVDVKGGVHITIKPTSEPAVLCG